MKRLSPEELSACSRYVLPFGWGLQEHEYHTKENKYIITLFQSLHYLCAVCFGLHWCATTPVMNATIV